MTKQATTITAPYPGNTSIPSSWISDVLYRRTPDGQTYLALILTPRTSSGPSGRSQGPTALLYSARHPWYYLPCWLLSLPSCPAVALLPFNVPSYLPGLIQAALGGRSIGRAYNRLLKGKGYPEQTVTGWREVGKLKKMMVTAKGESK